MAHALGKVWLKESLREHESDKIIYELFTLEAQHSFDITESAFDNVIYQRENLTQVCNALKIPSLEILRMSEMILSQRFHYWQPIEIQTVRDFENKKRTRAVILADMIGLGKTWIMVDWLLSVSQIHLNVRPVEASWIYFPC